MNSQTAMNETLTTLKDLMKMVRYSASSSREYG